MPYPGSTTYPSATTFPGLTVTEPSAVDEFVEGFNAGPDGAVATTSNTGMDRVLANNAPGPPVFTTDSHSGPFAIRNPGGFGSVMLGHTLPGVEFNPTSGSNSTNLYTLADPATGMFTTSVWAKATSDAVSGSSIIYLEVQNVAAWNDTEYVVDYTYNDYDGLGISYFYDDYVSQGSEPGQNIWIYQHGPNFDPNDFDGTQTNVYGTIPPNMWLKYELSYALDGSSRATVSDGNGTVYVDSGWSGGWPNNAANPAPDGWRPAAVWLRGRSNVTLDDFSTSMERPAPPPPAPTAWPRSTDFENETSQTPVTFDNSIFTRIDWELADSDYADFGAIFSDTVSHSGTRSITGGPVLPGQTRTYSELQAPVDAVPLVGADETLTFWHRHVAGTNGQISSSTIYEMWGGVVGVSRLAEFQNAVGISWMGDSAVVVSMVGTSGPVDHKEIAFPAGQWVRFEVKFTFETKMYSVKVTNGAGLTYGTHSKVMVDLGLSTTNTTFAFHSFYPTNSTFEGRNWFDDINYEIPLPPPEPKPPTNRIEWGDPKTRYFEAGLDRGVLYPRGGQGVPWNGLISVDEEGADGATSYYIDGRPYLHLPAIKEFKAGLTAYMYPDEFAEMLGQVEVAEGMYLDTQNSRHFDLSYRTKIGNATGGLDHGYKIHLIYNATVTPQNLEYETISDSINPTTFSWSIETVPVNLMGYEAMAHVIIDSRELTPEQLEAVENLLYGGGETLPALPDPQVLYDLLGFGDSIIVIDNGDGTFEVQGSNSNVYMIDAGIFQIDNVDGQNNGDGTFTISSTTA